MDKKTARKWRGKWFDGPPPVEFASAHESQHPDRSLIGELQISEAENVHRYVKGDASIFGDWVVLHLDSPLGTYPSLSRFKVVEGNIYMALGFCQWLRLDTCRWARSARYFPVGQDGLPICP